MSTPPLYRLALSGFQQANSRLAGLLTNAPNRDAALIAAMEAAYWANALDLRLREDDAAYLALTGDGPGLMRGLRFIRNRAAHQLPMVVEVTGGLRAPIKFPLTVHPIRIRWVDASVLPPAEERHRNAGAEACYVARFQGRPVDEVLTEVAHWFDQEQARTGSLLST
ncbi:hypothetical protein [Streptomyces wuyuanensis]|uniref:hypothetical protein n=1 Tax=Streptomyces wuyuanensis TaxID=1196353 RepID=UPI0034466F5F